MLIASNRYGDTVNNTNVVGLLKFFRTALQWLNHNVDNAFFITILRLVRVSLK